MHGSQLETPEYAAHFDEHHKPSPQPTDPDLLGGLVSDLDSLVHIPSGLSDPAVWFSFPYPSGIEEWQIG
jgi:hypothetical protein